MSYAGGRKFRDGIEGIAVRRENVGRAAVGIAGEAADRLELRQVDPAALLQHFLVHPHEDDLAEDQRVAGLRQGNRLVEAALEVDARLEHAGRLDLHRRRRRQAADRELVDLRRKFVRAQVLRPREVLAHDVDDELPGLEDVPQRVLRPAVWNMRADGQGEVRRVGGKRVEPAEGREVAPPAGAERGGQADRPRQDRAGDDLVDPRRGPSAPGRDRASPSVGAGAGALRTSSANFFVSRRISSAAAPGWRSSPPSRRARMRSTTSGALSAGSTSALILRTISAGVPRGREQRDPGIHLQPGRPARLGERGHLWQRGQALRRRDGEQLDPARLHHRQRRGERREHPGQLAVGDRDEGLVLVAERHVDHPRAGAASRIRPCPGALDCRRKACRRREMSGFAFAPEISAGTVW